MRVLVTGCNGFIGGYVCQALIEAGHEVYGLGNRPESRYKLFGYYPADISEQNQMVTAAKKLHDVQVVIHCAAHISRDDADSRLMMVNAVGTQNIVTMAKSVGIKKLIYISSAPVIGSPVEIPITEEHPLAPKTMYHASKLAGEYIIKASGLDHVIFRVPSPIGVGMNPNTILPVFVFHSLKNEKISLMGQGGRAQNYISVFDIARAVLLSLNANASGVINLSGDCVSNIELAGLCIKITGSRSEITFSGLADPADREIWNLSGKKAADKLGFVPKVRLEETITQLAQAGIGHKGE